MPRGRQAGFTLMEVMIVVVLAGVVTLGLVAFYLTSQMMWMDASTQALAQRDATTIMETIREEAETADKAFTGLTAYGNSKVTLSLKGNQVGGFTWSAADSLVHAIDGTGRDLGPLAPTKVERFTLNTPSDQMPMLMVDTLRVRSTSGQRVELSGGFAMYNGAQ